MIGVISADLLRSSSYSDKLLEQVIVSLNQEFKEIEKQTTEDSAFKIYRGDSFQGVVHNPEEALKIAIQIKAVVNKINLDEKNTSKIVADVRLAIGIGTYDFKRKSVLESNGQAFQFSGRTLDAMKKDYRKLRLMTPSEEINAEFDASLALFDIVSEKWSTASAEVIYYLLKGYKETEIASALGISQSAVNQRKKAAGWDAIESLLHRYKQAIIKEFKHG